jgi:5'-3' exonuclease
MSNTNFILIDGSYFIFFRYFAVKQWFRLSHPEEKTETDALHPDFIDKFKTTFQEKMLDISQKLQIENPIILVGKDCPRKKIWRMKFKPTYKENRVYDASFLGGKFFEMSYKEDMFIKGGAKEILSCDNLEADDCLALTAKHIQHKYPDAKIWIITSDMDYLQLANDNVKLFNLKFKDLTDSKNSFKNAEKDLFCKIVTGDKSDCIPSPFKKCGIKTAEKLYNDRELFKAKLEKEDAYECFALNKKLIDFNEIPIDLVENFRTKYNFNY